MRFSIPILILMAGCSQPEPDTHHLFTKTALSLPAAPGSAQPNLAAVPDSDALLSWLSPDDGGRHNLFVAKLNGQSWNDPAKVVSSDRLFVNWADFPSVLALDDHRYAAHWLQKSGAGKYAYDVRLSMSTDAGQTWMQDIAPHDDGTETEHGFVSLVRASQDQFYAIWLDGRQYAPADGSEATKEMALRYALLDDRLQKLEQGIIDSRVCDCCQTDAVVSSQGLLVAYRDCTSEEIRDISYRLLSEDGWQPGKSLHDDGWQIEGCPVNGPALAARANRVAAAWFTAPESGTGVYLAISENGGESFAKPVQLDGGKPLGRVDVVMLESGLIAASWIETVGDEAEIRMRLLHPDGRLSPAAVVSGTSSVRAAGFPRLLAFGEQIIAAWTEAEKPTSIHSVLLTLKQKS